MSATYQLNQATRAAEDLKARLATEFAGDEQAIRDTLEGEIGLEGLISWAAKEMRAAEGMGDGLRGVINEMLARTSRFNKRYDALRAAIEAAMLAGEIKKLELPHVTLTISSGGQPKVIVTNEKAIPQAFMKQPPPVPDKMALKAAIMGGASVPGAELSNPQDHLTVRTK